MKKNKFAQILSILIFFGLVFYTGYLAGVRDYSSQNQASVKIKTKNGNVENYLSNMQVVDILGSGDGKNLVTVGKIYYVFDRDSKKTEILVEIDKSPSNIKNSEINHPIPNSLKISLAQRTADGLDYKTTQIGIINFSEVNNGHKQAKFSTILDDNISFQEAERILFKPLTEEEENIFTNNDPSLPHNLRGQISAYFWSIL